MADMSITPEEIDDLLDTALSDGNDQIMEFVESVNEQWEEKAWLSENQITALQNIVEKIEERR